MVPVPASQLPAGDLVPFRSAVRTWFAISLQTFGGPAGQIAVMQRTLVEERRWISQQRFLHALNYCMLLPGPEAQSSWSTSAGCCTAPAAAWSPAPCSSCPACSPALVALAVAAFLALAVVTAGLTGFPPG